MATFNFKSDQNNDYEVTIDGYRVGTELTPAQLPVVINFVSLAGFDRIYPAAIYRQVTLNVISPSDLYYSDLIANSYDVTIVKNSTTTIFKGKTQRYSLKESEAIAPYVTSIVCYEVMQYADKRSIDTLDYPADPITNKPVYDKVLSDVLNSTAINGKYSLNTIESYDWWYYTSSQDKTTLPIRQVQFSWLKVYQEYAKTFAGTFYIKPELLSTSTSSETEFFIHNYGTYTSARTLQRVEENPRLTFRPPINNLTYTKSHSTDRSIVRLRFNINDPVSGGGSKESFFLEDGNYNLKLRFDPGRVEKIAAIAGVETKTLNITLEAKSRAFIPTTYYYNFGTNLWQLGFSGQTYTGWQQIIEPREFDITPFTALTDFQYDLTISGLAFGEGIEQDIKLYNCVFELVYESEEPIFNDAVSIASVGGFENFDSNIAITFDNYYQQRTYDEGNADSNNILNPIAGAALTEGIFENSLTYYTAQYDDTQIYIDASFLVDDTLLTQPAIPFNFDYDNDGSNELIGLLNGRVDLKTEIIKGEFIVRQG